MYRWTDGSEPEGVPRRPEPPADDGPAWLTDRPEPRSAYLFGDEPDQPGTGWTDAPTGTWPTERSDHAWDTADNRPVSGWTGHETGAGWTGHETGAGWTGHETGAGWTGHDTATGATGRLPAAKTGWAGHHRGDDWTGAHAPHGPAGHHGGTYAPFEQTGGWAAPESTSGWRSGESGGWRAAGDPAASAPVTGVPAASPDDATAVWRPVTDASADETGRHRQRHRLRRPLLIGGAAAAATLVVSLGVGGVLLPSGDQRTEPIAADAPVAAAPLAPTDTEPAPDDALAAPSATAAPPSARPSPTRTTAPKARRSTAPSRQHERSSAPPATTAATSTPSSGISGELKQVVDLVNEERAKAGCKALTVDDKLMLAAQQHSQDQADHKTMSHDGSDGSDVGERLDRVGYAWRSYGENVAWNQQSPAAVMDAWMNSPGHRANILNCSFTEIGVGVARSNGPYWTQDFGTPR